jgi:hypothetical protein
VVSHKQIHEFIVFRRQKICQTIFFRSKSQMRSVPRTNFLTKNYYAYISKKLNEGFVHSMPHNSIKIAP